MNTFSYKLIDTNGAIMSGVIRLPYDDDLDAANFIGRDNKTVIYVKKLNRLSSFFLSKGLPGLSSGGKDKTTLAEFISNLTVMLDSGIPLITSLEETRNVTNRGPLQQAIDVVIVELQNGIPFAESAAKFPDIFPQSVIQLIKVGEETGSLSQALKDAGQHMQRLQQLIANTKRALIYPTLALTMMTGAGIFWLIFIVPQIFELFKEMQIQPPALTMFVYNLSMFLKDYIVAILAIFTSLYFLLLTLFKKTLWGKKMVQRALLHTPIINTVIIKSNQAFISENLSLMLHAGIDIRRALTSMTEIVNHEVYRDKISQVLASLTKGTGLSISFEEAELFPSFANRMIKVSEQSGSLDLQLDNIATRFRNELEGLVNTISKMIEPVVIIVAGAFFIIILVSLFMPIYDILGTLGI